MAKTWRDGLILIAVTLISTLLVWWQVGLNTVRQNFDGPYYAVVAKSFYNPQIIRYNFSFPLPLEYYPAHFPLYPSLMNVLDGLTGIGYLNAGLVINIITTAIGVVVIYKVFHSYKYPALFMSFAWLFWWPRMWAIRSIVSPETLFILLTVLSLYWFDKRSYFLAAVSGAAAVLTKSPGIILFVAYGLWSITEAIKSKKIPWRVWPIILIPLALMGLFSFYWLQTGDFFAYFHSGDNIHLQALPFKIFDSNQPWVGDFWLEDILWIYLVGGIGVWLAFKKNKVWGWFGLVFYTTLLFVSHRDLSRYALPLVPPVLLGLASLFEKKEVRWAIILIIVPLFFYTTNFLTHNTLTISNWAPFFSK